MKRDHHPRPRYIHPLANSAAANACKLHEAFPAVPRLHRLSRAFEVRLQSSAATNILRQPCVRTWTLGQTGLRPFAAINHLHRTHRTRPSPIAPSPSPGEVACLGHANSHDVSPYPGLVFGAFFCCVGLPHAFKSYTEAAQQPTFASSFRRNEAAG